MEGIRGVGGRRARQVKAVSTHAVPDSLGQFWRGLLVPALGHLEFWERQTRDGQGRRLGRCIRHSVSELGGNATTFYFKYDGAAKNFLNQISMQKANDFKSVRQALKALVRNAISTIAQKYR